MSIDLGAPGDVPAQRGSKPAGVRAHNERLVLWLLRRHGGLPKADIARQTGLSPQAVSVIMRALERDGLLIRGEPIRGRIGQPSIPLHLAPDGAFSLGLRIGRRSADLVLMDFRGMIRRRFAETYACPEPDHIRRFAASGIPHLIESLEPGLRERIVGLGIATPFDSWTPGAHLPPDWVGLWQGVDLATDLGELSDLTVLTQRDARAACGAELMHGCGSEHPEYVYLFISTVVGGSLVLGGAVYPGRAGNAGALGSMPIRIDGRAAQLADGASLLGLHEQLRAAGIPMASALDPERWQIPDEILNPWLAAAGDALAQAIVASAAVIDFPVAIVEGAMPPAIRARLVDMTRKAVGEQDLEGIRPPEVIPGTIGYDARAIGAASLPMYARYVVDTAVLFKGAT